MQDFPKMIAVTGPTATGKTALAAALAARWHGEILSADSRQLYRGMDLGTGKDLAEYTVNGKALKVHLIDVADPGEPLDLFRFRKMALAALADMAARKVLPIVAGGSTLYLETLLRDYALPGAAPDPEERKRLDAMTLAELNAELESLAPEGLAHFPDRDNRNRVRRAIEVVRATGKLPVREVPVWRPETLVLGVYYPRAVVRERIARRLDARFQAGMIDEVKKLHKNGVSWEILERYGLEYREIARYLQGQCPFETMRTELLNRIRQFAKRQDIWFRKMEREGCAIHWLEAGNREQADLLVQKFLTGEPLPPPQSPLSQVRHLPEPLTGRIL